MLISLAIFTSAFVLSVVVNTFLCIHWPSQGSQFVICFSSYIFPCYAVAASTCSMLVVLNCCHDEWLDSECYINILHYVFIAFPGGVIVPIHPPSTSLCCQLHFKSFLFTMHLHVFIRYFTHLLINLAPCSKPICNLVFLDIH